MEVCKGGVRIRGTERCSIGILMRVDKLERAKGRGRGIGGKDSRWRGSEGTVTSGRGS